jgi:hypothetical protein
MSFLSIRRIQFHLNFPSIPFCSAATSTLRFVSLYLRKRLWHIEYILWAPVSLSRSAILYVTLDGPWPSIKKRWVWFRSLQSLLSLSNSPDDDRSRPNRSTTWNVRNGGRSKFVSEILKQRINYAMYFKLVPNVMHHRKHDVAFGLDWTWFTFRNNLGVIAEWLIISHTLVPCLHWHTKRLVVVWTEGLRESSL